MGRGGEEEIQHREEVIKNRDATEGAEGNAESNERVDSGGG